MKKDKYSKARGSWSRILDITCSGCKARICFYQKDGSGPLKRMYLDRIINGPRQNNKLICGQCQRELGIYFIYLKEKRPSYRLFQNSVTKKIVSQSSISA